MELIYAGSPVIYEENKKSCFHVEKNVRGENCGNFVLLCSKYLSTSI